MNKKRIIEIGVTLVVVVIGIVGFYFLNNQNSSQNNQNKKTSNQDIIINNDSKILVAYFSLPETDNLNDMTEDEENSAIVVDGEVLGNTQYVAMQIADQTNATLYRIEAEQPYPLNHDELVEQASQEQDDDARPKIKTSVDSFERYDVIYVGYPNWWGDMPQIMYTFLESYDFTGKTVIPFATHGGSGLSNTVETITDKLPKSTVVENAFALSRNSVEDAPKEVNSWLKEIGMAK